VKSKYFLFIGIFLIISITELIIMFSIQYIEIESIFLEALYDVAMLTSISIPLIYFMIYRPYEEQLNKYIEENKLQQEHILEQSRLSQMGEMIGNIAHQWRQPLNTLSLIVQKIGVYHNRGILDDEKLKTSVDKSMLLIDTMSSTIDDFRNFFKPNKEKETFSISNAVEKAFLITLPILKNNNIKCNLDVDESLTVYGYKNEFIQVIINLLNNAKDAMLENSIKDSTIVVLAKKIDNSIVIRVNDNAGGINSDVLEKIFDPYFTTKEHDKGTGIGLYMSKVIIEDHMSGVLRAYNNESGAVFEIIFDL